MHNKFTSNAQASCRMSEKYEGEEDKEKLDDIPIDSESDDDQNASNKTPKFNRKKLLRQNAQCEGMEVIHSRDEVERIANVNAPEEKEKTDESNNLFSFLNFGCCAQSRDAETE